MPASWLLPIFAISASLGATFGLFLLGTEALFIGGSLCFVAFALFARSRIEWRMPLSTLVIFVLFAWGSSRRLAEAERISLPPEDFRSAWEVSAEVKEGCRPSRAPCSFEAEVHARRRLSAQDDEASVSEPLKQRVRIYLSGAEWVPHTGDQFVVTGRYRPSQATVHPYAFNSVAWSARQGIAASFQMTEAPIFTGVRPSVFRSLDQLRVRAELDLLSYERDEATGILIAMLSGTKGGLTEEVKSRFAASGIAHVLAVSGIHLSLMTAALYFLLSKVLNRLRWVLLYFNAQAINAGICIPVIVLYVIFTGAPASALRAGIMAVVVLTPQLFGRRSSGIHALSFAVIAMLLVDPLTIVDVGFLLSVAATLALVLLAKEKVRIQRSLQAPDDEEDFDALDDPSEEPSSANLIDGALSETLTPTNHISGFGKDREPFWKQAVAWTWTSIVISTVSTLATAPFLVWSFGGIPWASPIPNLIVVPPLSIIAMPASAIGVMTTGWLPWVSKAANYVAIYTTEACLWVCRVGAPVFEQELLLGRPHLIGVVGWAMVAICSPWLNLHRKAPWAALVAGSLLVAIDWWERQPAEGQLEIHAIPVGQGDATWIRFPDGPSILIDAGGSGVGSSKTGTRFVLPYLRAHGVQHVEVLVATHGDADHIMGIVELAPILKPKEIWVGGIDLRRQAELELYLASKPLRAPYVSAHERYAQANIGEAKIAFLPSDRSDSSNDGSLVFALEYGQFRALFTGDIEKDREAFLVDVARAELNAHYLKIPHHGSRTSSTPAFLSAVDPVIGIIHAGQGNRHNLPREDVLDRYRARDVALWRTDRGVSVVHSTDGERVWLLRRHRWIR